MKNLPLPALTFIFLFPLLIGFSSLSTPFSLTNDPQMIEKFQNIKNSNLSSPAEITNYLPYAIAGANPKGFHLYRLLIFSLSSLLIFLTIYRLTQSSLSGTIASFGYLFASPNIENWSSLKSPDPVAGLLLIFGIFALINLYYKSQNLPINKKAFFAYLVGSAISFSLAIFIKDSSLAIIPPLFLLTIFSLLISKKFDLYTQSLSVITLITIASAFFYSITNRPELLNLNQNALISNLKDCAKISSKDTGFLLPLSILFLLIIIIKKSKDLRRKSNMFKVFCLFFLAFSVSLMAIKACSSAIMPLFLFIGCSLSYFLSLTRRLKKATLGRLKVLGHFLFIIFISYILIFFYFQIKEVVKSIGSNKEKTNLHSDMIKNLNQNIKENSKIYFIIKPSSKEYTEGVAFYLNLFYNKSPKIERLNPNLLPPLSSGDLIVVSRQFQEIPDDIIAQILSRKTLLYHTYLWTIYKIER